MNDRAAPPRNVLVTGATGFVGQHLVASLLRRGDTRVRALVRDPERLHAIFDPDTPGLSTARGDLTDPASLHGLCEGLDAVFHCAIARLHTFHDGTGADAFDAVNRQGSRLLAQEAIRAGVPRFVFVSSTAAMGTPDAAVVDEQTPCRPSNPYQRSKREAELALLDLHRAEGLNPVIVRPCLVTGPGKEGGELLKLFKLCQKGRFPAIGGSLDVEKPLIDVLDLVQALELAAERGRPGQIYLVHSDAGHTLGDILRAAARLVGNPRPSIPVPLPLAWLAAQLTTPVADLLRRPPPLSPERLRLFITSRRIDIRKARRELGFNPRHQDPFEMLGRTYDFYRASGQL